MKNRSGFLPAFLSLSVLIAASSVLAQAPAPAPAPRQDDGTLRGIFTVTNCDAAKMLVTARDKDGKEIVFVLNKDTRIIRMSENRSMATNKVARPSIAPAAITDLTAGTTVRVRYTVDAGKNTALMVVIGKGWTHGRPGPQPGEGDKRKEPAK